MNNTKIITKEKEKESESLFITITINIKYERNERNQKYFNSKKKKIQDSNEKIIISIINEIYIVLCCRCKNIIKNISVLFSLV
jgi:hypothetical protein